MHRRTLLQAAASLALPAQARAQGTGVLRFVPHANLANVDPVWGFQYVVRNASLLIWDTLYGIDRQLRPQPQMAENHDVSHDGKIWTFRLRPGLMFHDGEPVRARDAVASLRRWMARDTMGQVIAARLDAMEAVDDLCFRLRLSRPFPRLVSALAKANTPMAFIMPERIASTDPFKQIQEMIGSGPMRFAEDEWVPGSRAVFRRFADYRPRDEAADWLAGGKRMLVDRLEWHVMPDPATAAAALQNGEVDWWETPLPDVVPLLKRNRSLAVDIADPLGNLGTFRMNHLHPPFNDVRVRRAVQMALNQEDYMHAVAGDDPALWMPLPSFFTPGTPDYTEEGGHVLNGPRRLEEARRLVAASGYNGDPVVLLVGMDQPIMKAQSDVTADLLGRLGMKVDYVATDWGSVATRRARKDPPSRGGWNLFHTYYAGIDCLNPGSFNALATTGDKAAFGWPKSEAVQATIDAWYEAPTPEDEQAAVRAVNTASMDFVTYIPTGFFLQHQAWRTNLSGVARAPFPVFWGVAKG